MGKLREEIEKIDSIAGKMVPRLKGPQEIKAEVLSLLDEHLGECVFDCMFATGGEVTQTGIWAEPGDRIAIYRKGGQRCLVKPT